MARRSTAKEANIEADLLHPKNNEKLFAHKEAENRLLAMINAGRLPHALLINGAKGIGKATLAYRLARFLLAPPDNSGSLFGDALPPESLFISHEHPTFKRVVSGGHSDLLVLEGDTIKVEDARKVVEFLALTPAESDRRVVIIDSIDAMNRNAANALLKTLEEPPAQAVLILISHNPGRLLPTILSRCRNLKITPLSEIDFAHVMAHIAPEIAAHDYRTWGVMSGFSPGIALNLIENQADDLYKELLEILLNKDDVKLHAFAERFAKKDGEENWKTLARLLLWLPGRIACVEYDKNFYEVCMSEKSKLLAIGKRKSREDWISLWEKFGKIISQSDGLYLDKKQAVITMIRAAE